MKTTRELFLREQVLANLRFLFGKEADVLIGRSSGRSGVVAVAYRWGINGQRVKVMQASGCGEELALRKLLSMSSDSIGDFLGDQVAYGDLASCYINLPHYVEQATEDLQATSSDNEAITPDEPNPREIQKIEEKIEVSRGDSENNISDAGSEQILLTPQASDLCHGQQEEYSLLVHIQYPYQPSIGALRSIRQPSRQGLLQVILDVLARQGVSNPGWPIGSLCIRQSDRAYDILGYTSDCIGDLFEEILKTEKLIKVECAYGN